MQKVLLLTNDLMTRTRLASHWRKAGADVVSGSDILAGVDFIVLDLTLPDAHSLIQQLKSQTAAPILVFGPHVDGESFKEAREAGADEAVARAKVLEKVLGRLQG